MTLTFELGKRLQVTHLVELFDGTFENITDEGEIVDILTDGRLRIELEDGALLEFDPNNVDIKWLS